VSRAEWEDHLATLQRKQAQRIGKTTSAQKAEIAQTWNGSKVDTRAVDNMEFVTVTSGGARAVPGAERVGGADGGSLRVEAAASEPTGHARPAGKSGPLTSVRPLERDVLPGVLKALQLHHRVAWAQRMNVVAQKIDDRFVRAGFKGLSDIIGQLKDGRLLAVEVKRPGGMPTAAQVEFLGLVDRSGGIAFVARSIDDVIAALSPPKAVA
jgi:hypothetical protein